jgi:hypothetical protein
MNQYRELKDKHQNEFNEFPIFFAYNDKQFEEGMVKFGLTKFDINQIYRLDYLGGYYRRTDSAKLHEMFERHGKEMQDAVDADTTGEGFIYDMFNYELANHEFIITGDVSYTLKMLGLTEDEVVNSESLRHGLELAIKNQYEYYRQNKE